MNVESIIKGRIAEHITGLLFEESGYKVVRIAEEGLLVNVIREDTTNLNKSDSAGKITTAPSLCVFDKKRKNITILKVKYKGPKNKGGNIGHGIGQLKKYWPEASLVVVTYEEPYFQIIKDLQNKVPIEEFFQDIKKETIFGFGDLVKKFLV